MGRRFFNGGSERRFSNGGRFRTVVYKYDFEQFLVCKVVFMYLITNYTSITLIVLDNVLE